MRNTDFKFFHSLIWQISNYFSWQILRLFSTSSLCIVGFFHIWFNTFPCFFISQQSFHLHIEYFSNRCFLDIFQNHFLIDMNSIVYGFNWTWLCRLHPFDFCSVCTLHQRMLDLQRRFRDRVQTNGFHNVISPISAPLVGHSVSPGGLSRSSTSQIDQRYAFLTPIQRCMRWINEHLVAVEQGSHGSNWKSERIPFWYIPARPAFSLFQLHAQFVLHFWLGYLNSSEAERTLDTWVL